MTAKFLWRLLLGQIVSLLLVGTNATAQLLADRGFAAPTFQSFINYFMLCVVFIPMSLFCIPERTTVPSIFSLKDGRPDYGLLSKIFVFAVADVEANFLLVKAYEYTSITSITLLDCFAVPCVVVLSYCFLGVRYRLMHGIGAAACLAGLVLLVTVDFSNLKEAPPPPPPVDQPDSTPAPAPSSERMVGDGLALTGAALYAVSNVLQESLACAYDWREVLGALGAVGAVLSGIQWVALESPAVLSYPWTGVDVGLLSSFSLCLFLLYAAVPSVLMASGATFLNLSLLTSDFWAILFGVMVLRERPSGLYFIAFSATIAGLIVYHLHGEPPRPPTGPDDSEHAGGLKLQTPAHECARRTLQPANDSDTALLLLRPPVR